MGPLGENTVRIFLSAGEASGDLHGSYLVKALRAHNADVEVTCLGGPLLRKAGAAVLVDNRDLAVVGLFEVLRHRKSIHGAWKRIRSHLLEERPDVVVLIDFPDFNLMLARLAKRLGIRVFYYISPQVWAWRKGRVRTLKRLVHEMAVILPFEPSFYAECGFHTHYVGHPLLDVLASAPSREEARRRYRQATAGFLVGLLPGSRQSEIRSLLPVLFATAVLLRSERPEVSFILPVAPSLDARQIETEAARYDLPLQVVAGDTYGAIRACDLILTASGTVTLESAILGIPMIIIYRVSSLTYYAGRHLIRVEYVGLPNLIAGRRIVPELLQRDAQPQCIAAEALRLLRQPELLQRQHKELAIVQSRLGKPGVADRVARLVLKCCRTEDPASVAAGDRTGGYIPLAPRSTGCASSLFSCSRPPGVSGLKVFHLYNVCITSLWPVLFCYYGLRTQIDGKYRTNFLHRLGLKLPPKLGPSRRIWIHALSVGEALSAAPLVRLLKENPADAEIVFSTATETGQRVAHERLGAWVDRFFYLPHDFPRVMELLVERVQPALFVLVESDVWPNLLDVLRRRHVPTVLANARLSPTAFRRLAWLHPFSRALFEHFDVIFAQSRLDAERFAALGLPRERLRTSGNLKFDALFARLGEPQVDALRAACGVDQGRPVWIAGSTHAGEERTLLEVHRSLRHNHPDLLLILAPRRPQRTQQLLSLCRRLDLAAALRSQSEPAAGKAVLLLDTLGELNRFYALADAAFIGGSLIPFGGHNPLEAVAQGKAAVWGPHLFNFREMEAELLRAGCCRKITSGPELESVLNGWLQDGALRHRMKHAANRFIASHSGCSREMARFLLRMLHAGNSS